MLVKDSLVSQKQIVTSYKLISFLCFSNKKSIDFNFNVIYRTMVRSFVLSAELFRLLRENILNADRYVKFGSNTKKFLSIVVNWWKNS